MHELFKVSIRYYRIETLNNSWKNILCLKHKIFFHCLVSISRVVSNSNFCVTFIVQQFKIVIVYRIKDESRCQEISYNKHEFTKNWLSFCFWIARHILDWNFHWLWFGQRQIHHLRLSFLCFAHTIVFQRFNSTDFSSSVSCTGWSVGMCILRWTLVFLFVLFAIAFCQFQFRYI